MKEMSTQSAKEPVFHGMVRITSLGCAKNFVDTELASASFLCSGFGLTDDDDEADVQFVNTCAFLKEARDEASGIIRDLKRWKAACPGRHIIVAGCFVQWASAEELAKYPYVDAWMRIDTVSEAGKIALSLQGGSAPGVCGEAGKPKYIYDDATPRVQLTPSHYAYVKIADGCDNCCAYCLIPSIRGSLRSRTEESVVKEVRSLIGSGVKEIILIAQDTGGFGRDRDGVPGFAGLLKKLDELPGDFWLRVMYLHPASVGDELLSVLKNAVHVIRCIEMPIQHIADNVLKGMGRKVYGARTREVIRRIMDLGYAVRTTLMTGFPGETKEDYEELLEFVKETKFERLGVFAYSAEPGTRAAELPGQVPAKTASARRAALLKAQRAVSLEHNRALIGTELPVIVDEITGRGRARGRTLYDAPDIDNLVNLRFKGKLAPGAVVTAKVEEASEYELNAAAAPEGGKA